MQQIYAKTVVKPQAVINLTNDQTTTENLF